MPITVSLNKGTSLTCLFQDVLEQIDARDRNVAGVRHAETVVMYLIRAVFEMRYPNLNIWQMSDSGYIVVGNTAVHVKGPPSEDIIQKCMINLDEGLRPMIIMRERWAKLAEYLANQMGIVDRVDVFAAEQFIASCLHEMGEFDTDKTHVKTLAFIQTYNRIVDECEKNRRLRISIRRKSTQTTPPLRLRFWH